MALSFAYDGGLFESFARQPRHRTVEGELLGILRRHEVLRSAASAGFGVASRTDAGVSAAQNVCAFDTRADPRTLAHLRHDVEGLWLLSAAVAPPGFSPRHAAKSKTYVYHVVDPEGIDWVLAQQAAALFVGRHDFHNFCRPDRDAPTVRTLSRLTVEPERLRFEAPNFLWEQVRRVTGGILAVARGELTLERLRRRLSQPGRDPQPPAPAEGLVLERVDVPLSFPAASKSAVRRVEALVRSARARLRFYETFASSLPTMRR